MTDAPKGKSILEQLIEEASEAGRKAGQSEDFAVNLSTTDKDGNKHSLEGIPVSQARRFLFDKFGIGDPPGEGEGQAEGEGEGQAAHPIKAYFGQGKSSKAG
jgi:hypothetical protein